MPDVDPRSKAKDEEHAREVHLEPIWSSELSQRLFELVEARDLQSGQFQEGVEALVEEYGEEVFSELLYLLCHLRFEPEESKNHWQRIAEHRDSMAAALQSTVDVRVAMVSYFLDTHSLLESPTVIELRLLEPCRGSLCS